MPQSYCLCEQTPTLRTSAMVALIQHREETKKLSNTGKLVKQCLPESALETWHRKQPLHSVNQPNPVLVFPSDDNAVAVPPSVDQTWLIIDATWQQARKMLRQTPALAALPRVSITANFHSEFTLRRNQTDNGLCTLEVVAALLNQCGEVNNALALRQYLRAFMQAYRAQRHDVNVPNG